MVLNKRLDFGFNGFQVPTIPKAPRSARRRRAQRNAVEDGPICAFELLASLAAKLLRESESSSASSHASQGNTQSAFSKDVKQELQDGHKPLKDECLYQNCSEESVPIELTSKAIDRNCTKKKLLHAECASVIHNASFSRHRNDSKLGVRDDDEKFSWCDKLSTMVKVFRPRSLIGDRRIRKLLASKYWKVAPKVRECDNLIYDGRVKPTYHKRKIFYNHERTRRDTLCKRRKMVTQSSIVTSDGGLKGMNGDKNVPVNGVSSSIKGPQASLFSRESHVSVPELFIEVPTTETIGSLKKTVMEAVNAILNGGLNVGVLVQGKKVRDDNRTLLQSGISCKDNQDSLGFMLESSPVEAPAYLCRADPLPLSCDASVLLRGSPSTPLQNRGLPDIVSDHTLLLTNPDLVESDHEKSCFSHIEPLTNEGMPECQATVALPYMSMEPLAAVPVNLKCKRPEVMQRRTRRPFSVTEVEALVQAVEDLGTGRWRDIKLSAFDNADHRTYVDLKDKWKTLVHTAQISPQQRRGEPVPQELLDRVLAAHLYLSQNQAKQQGKHETCIRRITDTNSTDGAERYSPLSYDVENSKVDRNREKEMPVKITLP